MTRVLPTTWVDCTLDDLLVQISNGANVAQHEERVGYPISRIETIWNETIDTERVRYIKETDSDFVAKYALREGDILLSHINSDMHLGKTALYQSNPPVLIHGINLLLIRLAKSVSSKFINYQFKLLRTKGAFVDVAQRAVNQSSINQKKLKTFSLVLPPINEQHRIVAKIEELFSELDKGIESLKHAQKQLKLYRQALLKHAFEGKLTEQWRKENADQLETAEQLLERIKQERESRYQQQLKEWQAAVNQWEADGKEGKKLTKPRKPKDLKPIEQDIQKTLSALPEGWAWEKLGWMTTGVEYGTSAKSQKQGSHPVLRMGNIQNAKFDWSDLVYTSVEEEIEKYLLRVGDVLFNRTNSPELVGKTAIYTEATPALFAGYLIRVNQIDCVVISQYLNLFLNSHVAKQYGNTVKTDGVNQSNINGEKLSNYPFPYCSFAEQRKVVEILDEKLSVIDACLSDTEINLARSDALRQSILKKAFSGQLVPQDPNDEPASALLDRIAKEKTEATAKTKKSKATRKKRATRRVS